MTSCASSLFRARSNRGPKSNVSVERRKRPIRHDISETRSSMRATCRCRHLPGCVSVFERSESHSARSPRPLFPPWQEYQDSLRSHTRVYSFRTYEMFAEFSVLLATTAAHHGSTNEYAGPITSRQTRSPAKDLFCLVRRLSEPCRASPHHGPLPRGSTSRVE